MNTNNNVVVLMIAAVALTLGLVFTLNYKQRTKAAQDQSAPNQWKNWNNQPKNPPVTPPVQNVARNYQEAVDMSRQTGKKIFLFFGASWCSWCEKMKADTLSDSLVKQQLSGYIICIVDRDQERTAALKYVVTGIPAYFITDSSEKAAKRGQGYKTPQELMNWLNAARPDPDNRQPAPPPRRPG